MILYRIAREKYARDLSGNGGLISSARWHNRMPAIYASLNSSTCILEKLVHLAPEEIHNDLMIITLELSDTIASEKIAASQLTGNWKEYPAPVLLQNIGNAWLRSKSAVLLFVPSAIDPLAENALLNPMHADISKICIREVQSFTYDERLLFLRFEKQ
jgi:RES domain-containing protein